MRNVAIGAIVLANILGGLTYVGQDMALQGLPYATITLGRNLVAMALMAVLLRRSGGMTWRYPRADFLRLLIIGVVAYAAPLLLGTIGTQWSTAANGSILILFEPCAILIFARMLLGEHIRRMQAVGIGIGMVGALFIVLKDAPVDGLLQGQHLRGNLVLMLHAILWGLYSPLMKPLAGRYGAVDVTLMTMVLAQLLLVPAALAEVDQWQAGPQLASALGWTVALGLFGSFAATVLWTVSLKHLRASTVAIFVFLQPLAGVAGDSLLRGRAVTTEALIGGAFIAVGVLLVVLKSRPAAPEIPQEIPDR